MVMTVGIVVPIVIAAGLGAKFDHLPQIHDRHLMADTFYRGHVVTNG